MPSVRDILRPAMPESARNFTPSMLGGYTPRVGGANVPTAGARDIFYNYSPSVALAADRAKFGTEIANNPKLLKMIAAMGQREVGGPGSEAAYGHVEAMMNRVSSDVASGKTMSLAQTIESNYYEPFKKGGYQQELKTISPETVEKWRPIVDAALGGINTSGLATGTASGPEHAFAKAGFFGQGIGKGLVKILGGELMGEEQRTANWRAGMSKKLEGEQTASRELDTATPAVNGNGKLAVDVRAPSGVKVNAAGEGLFNKTETNRRMTERALEE